MKMKSIELFCASPGSTAICSNTDHRAIIRPGTRPVDRRVHRLGEPPKNRTNVGPCLSQLPFDPSRRSYHKPRKNNNNNTDDNNNNTSAKQTQILRRKSSADVDDLASASRYLLSDQPFLDDVVSDRSVRGLVSSQVATGNFMGKYKRLDLDGFRGLRPYSSHAYEEYPVFKPPSGGADTAQNPSGKSCRDDANALKSTSNHQVVELRVSIHCKGCEGKLRKYISRMEGVTSFSIDLATKKVRIVGDVTPLGVLKSVSKVKNAQFWDSPTTSSSSSSLSSPRTSSLTNMV